MDMGSRRPRSGRRSQVAIAVTLAASLALSVAATSFPAAASTSAGRVGGQVPPWLEHRVAPKAPKPCGSRKQAVCGTVQVPLDRTKPGGKQIKIDYEHYLPTGPGPQAGTIVAVEGGPGYPTTRSRAWYTGLFRPLMDEWGLLLVDLRGTGRSAVVDCRPLQDVRANDPVNRWINAVGACGRQLGKASSMYGTANAAGDMADVLDALGIDTVALYGDSYGTYFSQTFAIRYPDRLDALILDAAYPVGSKDPWWSDWHRAANQALRNVCDRSPTCAPGGDPVQRLAKVVKKLRKHPVRAYVPDADGVKGWVDLTPHSLISILSDGGYDWSPYRNIDGALRAALRGDMVPLLRQARMSFTDEAGGPVLAYSAGQSYAVSCNDYPLAYDKLSPPKKRPKQYAQAIAKLKQDDPDAFWPFSVEEEVSSPLEDFDTCTKWPVPKVKVPLLPKPVVYPTTPTLVLVGDLDSVTSPEGSQQVADNFPNSTFVEVPNGVHVVALGDHNGCVAQIVLRFVQDHVAGDTSCVQDHLQPVRTASFPTTAGQIPGPSRQRSAIVAASVVSDAIDQWGWMGGWDGVGLRGGSFTTRGYALRKFTFRRTKFVQDQRVSGEATWSRKSSRVRATLTIDGPGGPSGKVTVSWKQKDLDAGMDVTGKLGGKRVEFNLPVP